MAIRDGSVNEKVYEQPHGHSESGNIILSAIGDDELEQLEPYLERVDLPQHYILHEQGEEIEHVYFPEDGMVSLVVLAGDGRSVEVGLVGREGVIGTPRAVGITQAPHRAISQIPGRALRLRGELLDELLPYLPGLREAFGRYTLIQSLQVAQIAACNRLHEVDQRLARWLLMCQDRVERKKLLLTHEFLAQMLGTGRPSVSLATSTLERGGLIDNQRGAIRILNRAGLEETACECYRVVQDYNSGLGIG